MTTEKLTNQQRNIAFLNATDTETARTVISSIAVHYGISNKEAMKEVTGPEAESIVDYLVEPIRSATYVLMQRHSLV